MADPEAHEEELEEEEEEDEDEDDEEEEEAQPLPRPQTGGHVAQQRRNNRRGGGNNNHQGGGGGNPQNQGGGNTVGQQARLFFGDMLSSMPPEMIRTIMLVALDEIEKRPGFKAAVVEVRAWMTQYVSDDFLKNRILPALIIGANISPILPPPLRPVVGNILDDVLNSLLFDAYRNYEYGTQSGGAAAGQPRLDRPRCKTFLEALNDVYPEQRIDLDALIERVEVSPEATAAWQRVRGSQLYPRDLDALLAWASRRGGGDVQNIDPSEFVKYIDRWLDRVPPPPPSPAAAPQGLFGGALSKFNKVVGAVEAFIGDMAPPPPPPGAPPALPGPQAPPRRKTFRRY